MNVVNIEMKQGFNRNGELITHVSKNFDFRKYGFLVFYPVGEIVTPTARFMIKYRLPKKKILEINYQERVENILYTNLCIYQKHD